MLAETIEEMKLLVNCFIFLVFSLILQELWEGCEGVFLLRISGGQSQEMMELVLGIKTFLIYFNNFPLPPHSCFRIAYWMRRGFCF